MLQCFQIFQKVLFSPSSMGMESELFQKVTPWKPFSKSCVFCGSKHHSTFLSITSINPHRFFRSTKEHWNWVAGCNVYFFVNTSCMFWYNKFILRWLQLRSSQDHLKLRLSGVFCLCFIIETIKRRSNLKLRMRNNCPSAIKCSGGFLSQVRHTFYKPELTFCL